MGRQGTVNYAMNKFMRLSLLTKRLSSFLKAAVMRRLARDSRPCNAGLSPLNPEAILLVDCGVASPNHCLTTGEQQPQRYSPLPSVAASVGRPTEALRAGCLD